MIGITGANGFVGKSLCNFLKEVDLRIFKNNDEINLLNKEAVECFVNECDVIVHLGGKNRGKDLEILDTNILGSYHVASSCLFFKKPLIYSGTDYSKVDAYGISKDVAQETISYLGDLGLQYTMFKFPKIFGPGCKPFYNSFISTILHCHAKNKEYKHLIKNYNDVLKLMHIDNVCVKLEDAIFSSPKNETITFNNHNDVFLISIGEVIDIIEGRSPYHVRSEMFLKTLEWYQKHDFTTI